MSAATRTWTGNVDGNWATAGNWASNAVPVAGDDLIFSTTAARQLTTNNLGAAIAFHSVTFSGSNYVLNGSAIALSGGITLSNVRGTNTIAIAIECTAGQTFSCVATSAVLQVSGALTLDGLLTVSGAGTNIFTGAMAGAGGVTKNGSGLMRFGGSGANSYAGVTTVNAGVLQLAKSITVTAVPESLVVGNDANAATVRLFGPNQITSAGNISVKQGSILDLNGFDNIVNGVSLHGGTVSTGTGTLTSLANISTLADAAGVASVISGKLSLAGTTRSFLIGRGPAALTNDLVVSAVISDGGASAGIIKTNGGILRLTAANTFSGQTLVSGGTLVINNANALGASGNSTNGTVVSGAQFQIEGVGVAREEITLSGSSRFTGVGSAGWGGLMTLAGTPDVEVTGSLNLTNIVAGTGALSINKSHGGTLLFSGSFANTFSGTMELVNGTLLLSKDQNAFNGSVNGNLTIDAGAVVRLQNNTPQLSEATRLLINPGGLFDMNGIQEFFGSLADGPKGGGSVTLGANATVPDLGPGGDDSDSVFSGVISGTGGLYKEGAGLMALKGNNTYSGATTNSGGVMQIDGFQPQSAVFLEGGDLQGSGTVGSIFVGVDGANISAGTIDSNKTGILTCSNLVCNDTTTLHVDLNGTVPGAGYDQLNVRGSVNLGGASLDITGLPGFAPVQFAPIVIIRNDGSDPVAGTFDGLTNGSVVTVGKFPMVLNYNGGSGNDVTLTLVTTPAVATGVSIAGGDGTGILGANGCKQFYLTITNATIPVITTNVVFVTNGTAIHTNTTFKTNGTLPGASATLTTTTPHVFITQGQSDYPPIPSGGAATNLTPFLLSTLPNFDCLSNIDLALNLVSSYGKYSLRFALATGGAGTPVSFTNSTSATIPVVGTVTSTNIVSGINTPIEDISVALHLNHLSTGELTNISLVGPDGTTVLLAGSVGVNGADYGTVCTNAAAETVFNDFAATSISNGVAPFVGVFRPRQPLAAYFGKTGTNANGAWKLRISDGFSSGTPAGTLQCWTLSIAPRGCFDGGGYCGTCPGLITNAITTNDFTNSLRLVASGNASVCGDLTGCPGTTNVPSRYDVFTFTNKGGFSCINVALDGAYPLSVAAYYDTTLLTDPTPFNPADPCLNYRADLGSNTTSGSFAFPIDGASVAFDGTVSAPVYQIVVTRPLAQATNVCNYALEVSGGDCLPSLKIEQPATNHVRLLWPVSANGYVLETTPGLTDPAWTTVTDQPALTTNSFVVTNTVDPGNLFYRLHRP